MKDDIKDNVIELLKEDIECVHRYLDDLNVPRHDGAGTYSIVGRIKHMNNNRWINRVFRKFRITY